MFSITKIGRFQSAIFQQQVFLTFYRLQRLNAKNHCSCISLIFTSKAMHFMVWFPNSWFYFMSRKKCIIAMFISYFKKSEKNVYYVRFIALCLMLNWSRRHAFIYATKTWNLWGFFYSFLKVFAEKYIKYIFQRKWGMDWVWDSNNYMWLCSNLSIS